MDCLQSVRDQYNTFPYPRYVENTFHMTKNEYLENLCTIFGWTIDTFNNFKFLVAGCGTGNCVVWLASQIKFYDQKNIIKGAKVYGLDISENSLDICRQRLKRFKLEDYVELTHGSLLDCQQLYP